MGESMKISTISVLNSLINLVILGFGIEWTWCGISFFKTKDISRLPKLSGYLMLRIFQVVNEKRQSNIGLVRVLRSTKAMSVYLILGGSIVILGSLSAFLLMFA